MFLYPSTRECKIGFPHLNTADTITINTQQVQIVYENKAHSVLFTLETLPQAFILYK